MTMEWNSDNPGQRYTTTKGRYEATVGQTEAGHWRARICCVGAVELQDTFNTLEDAWAWCEARLAELAAAGAVTHE